MRSSFDEAKALDQQRGDLGLDLVKTISCGNDRASDARIAGALRRFQFHGDLECVH